VDLAGPHLGEFDAGGRIVETLLGRDEKLHQSTKCLEPVAGGKGLFRSEQIDNVHALQTGDVPAAVAGAELLEDRAAIAPGDRRKCQKRDIAIVTDDRRRN
jgi:hypothetical protein